MPGGAAGGLPRAPSQRRPRAQASVPPSSAQGKRDRLPAPARSAAIGASSWSSGPRSTIDRWPIRSFKSHGRASGRRLASRRPRHQKPTPNGPPDAQWASTGDHWLTFERVQGAPLQGGTRWIAARGPRWGLPARKTDRYGVPMTDMDDLIRQASGRGSAAPEPVSATPEQAATASRLGLPEQLAHRLSGETETERAADGRPDARRPPGSAGYEGPPPTDFDGGAREALAPDPPWMDSMIRGAAASQRADADRHARGFDHARRHLTREDPT